MWKETRRQRPEKKNDLKHNTFDVRQKNVRVDFPFWILSFCSCARERVQVTTLLSTFTPRRGNGRVELELLTGVTQGMGIAAGGEKEKNTRVHWRRM